MLFEVSRDGHLIITPGEKFFGYDNGQGYRILTLNGRTKSVHVLVAAEFVHNPRPDIFTQVDHINRVRDDNRASNLRWLSPQLNAMNKVKSQVRKIDKFFNKKTRHWFVKAQPTYFGYYCNDRVTKGYKTHAEADAACTAWRNKMFSCTYEMLTSGPVCAFYNDENKKAGGRRSSRS